jgi:hypothetical protein
MLTRVKVFGQKPEGRFSPAHVHEPKGLKVSCDGQAGTEQTASREA